MKTTMARKLVALLLAVLTCLLTPLGAAARSARRGTEEGVSAPSFDATENQNGTEASENTERTVRATLYTNRSMSELLPAEDDDVKIVLGGVLPDGVTLAAWPTVYSMDGTETVLAYRLYLTDGTNEIKTKIDGAWIEFSSESRLTALLNAEPDEEGNGPVFSVMNYPTLNTLSPDGTPREIANPSTPAETAAKQVDGDRVRIEMGDYCAYALVIPVSEEKETTVQPPVPESGSKSGNGTVTAGGFTVRENGKKNADLSYSAEGAYACVSIKGKGRIGELPVIAEEKAESEDPALTVLESWYVKELKNSASLTLDASVTVMPALADGETAAFYRVLSDGTLGTKIQNVTKTGDSVSLSLKSDKAVGAALVKTGGEEEAAELSDGRLGSNASKLFENEDLYLTGKMPKNGIVEVTPVATAIEGQRIVAAYDIKIYANEKQREKGKTWNPAGDKVQVHWKSDRFTDGEYTIYHIAETGAKPEDVATVTASDGWITFEAAGFSVYAVSSATLYRTVTTSDGATFYVQVTYQHTAGIPMDGTELLVSEMTSADDGYGSYLAEAAGKVGVSADRLELSKVFDIKIVDAKDHSRVYEPSGSVEVSIRLVGEELGTYANLDVLHFVENDKADGYTVRDMETTVSGETVQFTTDSFSVYVVAGYTIEEIVEAGDGSTYRVTVTYDETAGIPEGAVLDVKEVAADDYAAYLASSAAALGADVHRIAYSRLFDISIVKDGVEYQPNGSVTVKVELLDAGTVENVRVVHFGDADNATALSAATDGTAVTFKTNGFSIFSFIDFSIIPRTIGAALNTVITGLEGETEGTLYENDDIILTGSMPSSGIVEATRVDTTVNGQKALLAYDIKIYANALMKLLGITWQPAGESVQVTLKSDALNVQYANVYHMETAGAAPTLVSDGVSVENNSVTFSADSFSVYVVIDHEGPGATVETPRVMFHFISNQGIVDMGTYYKGVPYEFTNKGGDTQTTQILADGESLELVTDPTNQLDKYFYGWYMVDQHPVSGVTDSYGVGTSDSKLYYTWPGHPSQISFETPISIAESGVSVGATVHWTLNGASGSGTVDAEGNVHVFIAPIFENYNFINFMLYARDGVGSGASSLMTRKMVAVGSDPHVEVKISDIHSTSRDAVHLIFTGWEYNAGTELSPNWVQIQTLDYSGAEREHILVTTAGVETEDSTKDGVYCSFDLTDTTGIDLYPIFVEARWVDFSPGLSGNGASYVNSRFLESWGTATPVGTLEERNKNVFSTDSSDPLDVQHAFDVSSRRGYDFGGWYAFAVKDPNTGAITNLNTPADVSVSYIDVNDKFTVHTVTVNTTAIQISDGDGDVVYNGAVYLHDNGDGTGSLSGSGTNDELLFSADGSSMKLHDAIDRLKLEANWIPVESAVTVIYWTENVQDIGYVAPADRVPAGTEKDDYTAAAIKVLTTTELNTALSPLEFASGSTLTRSQLAGYTEASVGILSVQYLNTVGAVLPGEGKFYELNATLSDNSVTINGDGSTIINVYYSRSTFTLVFHIGRDGYVKTNGQQRPAYMEQAEYLGWDGNWIQFMADDHFITDGSHGFAYTPGPTAKSYAANFSMTYNGGTPADSSDDVVYTTGYVTSAANVMGDYLPSSGENVYFITAKYGAYIADRWPTPVSDNFTFTYDSKRTMYTWAAYYGSLYCRIANERSTYGNVNGNNPDINGIYDYMSAELCSNRAGDDIINANRVHHLVAYYGDTGKAGIEKTYHILYKIVDGADIPAGATPVSGTSYLSYSQTTWSVANGDAAEIDGFDFYEQSVSIAISNVEPQYQMGWEFDGYQYVYSCYNTPNPNDHHIYFFYKPNTYTLTFMYESTTESDVYYYGQSLAGANVYDPPSREGYYFRGWYTNEAGAGSPFDFANEKMPSSNLVLYPILRPLQYTVKIDPNGGVIDHRVNSSMATYFTGNYGTQVGEYTIDRGYIKLTAKEMDPDDPTYYNPSVPGQEWYYYINTQRLDIPSEGDWGLPTDLRNSVYVSSADIDTYYNWYANIMDTVDPDYWTGIQKLSKADFLATYADYPYRPLNSASEHYTFMGWYQVYDNGTVASMPFNFNDPVSGPLELRAKWRLDGGYYVQYNPYYFTYDSVTGQIETIAGELLQWMDPTNPSEQLYADQSPTHVLRAPTNTTEGWVFRGWRVVHPNGTGSYTDPVTSEIKSYIVWEPFELDGNGDPIYYQPGDIFVIDAELVSEIMPLGSVIHMQAYYEPSTSTYRRPDVTDLILDANDGYGHGYLTTSDPTDLPAFAGPGSIDINTTTELYSGNPTQILMGDIQSNLALHLYRYATSKTFGGITGTNFFTSADGHLLIGFDEEADPDNATTGDPYIPAFAPDSIASVTRKAQSDPAEVLYAMWEPMVYVTFVNTTDAPITVSLTGSGLTTVSVVNQVTGEFDREKVVASVVVPARSGITNGEVKVVFPKAEAGVDTITATAVNDHFRKKMSVSGAFQATDPYGTGCTDKKFGESVTYTGTLDTDPDGIIVTYTEIIDAQVLYDVNAGTWTDPSAYYRHTEGDVYVIEAEDITPNGGYEPTDPTRAGKLFIGWTTNADIAAHTDFSSTAAVTWGSTTVTPDAGGIILDKVKSDYLWDFSQDPALLFDNDLTLYAVWSDVVTVTFNVAYTYALSLTSKLHIWTDTESNSDPSEPYVYYRDNSTEPYYVTYKLAKGERVPKPSDPEPHTDQPTWKFVNWLYSNSTTDGNSSSSYRCNARTYDAGGTVFAGQAFDFSQRVTSNVVLITSWTTSPSETFTFKIRNEVVNGNDNDEFDYTIAVSEELVWGKLGTSSTNAVGVPDQRWGSITTSLKNNQEYTVLVKVSQFTVSWGPANSVEITVTDRDGLVVKSGHLFYCNKNTYKNFVSSFKYTMTVIQDAKAGYTTTVGTEDQFGTFTSSTSDAARSFTFYECQRRDNAASSQITPEENTFVADAENRLTVVFTNSGAVAVSPTGVRFLSQPFAFMLATGMILSVVVLALGQRKRKDEDENARA